MVNQDFSWMEAEVIAPVSGLRIWSIRIILLASALLVLQILFSYVVAPQIRITRILVEGAGELSTAKIHDLAGLKGKEYYFSVDQGAIENRLEKAGWFKRAKVEKLFPDTLKIILLRRVPVAVSLVSKDGISQVLALDEDGVICDIYSPGSQVNYPILSGVEFQEIKVGMKLPETLSLLMGELGSLKKNSTVLYQWISEINVHKSREHSFTMTIFPSQGSLKIQLADRLDPRILKEAAVVSDMLKKQGLDSRIREMDFRTDQIVLDVAEG